MPPPGSRSHRRLRFLPCWKWRWLKKRNNRHLLIFFFSSFRLILSFSDKISFRRFQPDVPSATNSGNPISASVVDEPLITVTPNGIILLSATRASSPEFTITTVIARFPIASAVLPTMSSEGVAFHFSGFTFASEMRCAALYGESLAMADTSPGSPFPVHKYKILQRMEELEPKRATGFACRKKQMNFRFFTG